MPAKGQEVDKSTAPKSGKLSFLASVHGQYTYAGFGQYNSLNIRYRRWEMEAGVVWQMNYSQFEAPAIGPHLSFRYVALENDQYAAWAALLVQYVAFQVPETETSSGTAAFLQYGFDYRFHKTWALTSGVGFGLYQENFQIDANFGSFETSGISPFFQLGIKKSF